MSSHWHDFSFAVFVVTLVAASSFATNLTAQEKAPFQDYLFSTLYSETVQNDLELLDDQKRELQGILGELSLSRSKVIRDLNEMSFSGFSKEEIKAQRKKMMKPLEAVSMQQLKNVLLPHQLDRLKQSTVQVMMKQLSKHEKVECGLLTSQMKEYLEIDDEQAKKIAEASKEAREELAEKIKELNAVAREKLLGELSAEQRKKYEELTGDRVRNLK